MMYAMITIGEPGDWVGVDGEEGGPQDEHVESEVGQHAEHARPAAAVNQKPLRVVDGVRESGDRVRDLGVLGAVVLGTAAGASGRSATRRRSR